MSEEDIKSTMLSLKLLSIDGIMDDLHKFCSYCFILFCNEKTGSDGFIGEHNRWGFYEEGRGDGKMRTEIERCAFRVKKKWLGFD